MRNCKTTLGMATPEMLFLCGHRRHTEDIEATKEVLETPSRVEERKIPQLTVYACLLRDHWLLRAHEACLTLVSSI